MSTEVTLDYSHGVAEQILLCSCGAEYLHQEAVEVFSRKEDDQATAVVIDQYTGSVDSVTSTNPSDRRHGIRIRFSCEEGGCEDASLVIFQHKGQTFMSWE